MMNLARKLSYVGLAAASGVLAAVVPKGVGATQVDPAIMSRFKERPAAENRVGAPTSEDRAEGDGEAVTPRGTGPQATMRVAPDGPGRRRWRN
jgi:hypothetical protein